MNAICAAGHAATVERIALCGRVPAQVIMTDAVAQRSRSVLAEVLWGNTAAIADFAAVCLDGSFGAKLPPEVRELAFFRLQDDVPQFTWTPIVISNLLPGHTAVHELFAGVYKARSGDVWEHIVLLAVLLRLEAGALMGLPRGPAMVVP